MWIGKTQLVAGDLDTDAPVYTFLNSLQSSVNRFDVNEVYAVWDKKLLWPSTNFRKESRKKDYKGNRKHLDRKLLVDCIEETVAVIAHLGVRNMFPYTMESDDVISWLSTHLDQDNIIISTDGDLLQLVSKKTVMFHLNKKTVITLENFAQEVGVKPEDYLTYKALCGDKSDNIKGVVGYGPVRAKTLVESFDLEHLSSDERAVFDENYRLMDLKNGYKYAGEAEEKSYQEQFEACQKLMPEQYMFNEYCRLHGFSSFIRRRDKFDRFFAKRKDENMQPTVKLEDILGNTEDK